MSDQSIDFEALLADPDVAAKLPKDLREFAERQAAKAKSVEEENAKLRAEVRAVKVNDFLASKGLPKELAGNVGDADPQEWYDQYGKYFAAQPAGQGETTPPGAESNAGDGGGTPAAGGQPPAEGAGNGAPPVSPGAALTPEQLQALAGIVGQVPQGAPGSAPVVDQLNEATKGATSVDDYLARLSTVPGALQ